MDLKLPSPQTFIRHAFDRPQPCDLTGEVVGL